MSVQQVLVIPHLKIHNANALSSPFTVGFPALTGFLGATHALQRKLNQQGIPVNFDATGVISHEANLQAYKGSNDFVHSIIGTGNPLDKTGARSAFIEEARIHLDVSLIVQFSSVELEQREALIENVQQLLSGHMKLAGGDILSYQQPEIHILDDNDHEGLEKLQRSLLPGYVLTERRDLMQQAMEQGLDALDSLIDYLAVHHHYGLADEDNAENQKHNEDNLEQDTLLEWHSKRGTIGWIIPIATGFQAISPLGEAKNQRDENTPHRFAESVVTLGEFKMPHRCRSLEAMLWRYQFDDNKDLYLCQQRATGVLLTTDQDFDEGDAEFA